MYKNSRTTYYIIVPVSKDSNKKILKTSKYFWADSNSQSAEEIYTCRMNILLRDSMQMNSERILKATENRSD